MTTTAQKTPADTASVPAGAERPVTRGAGGTPLRRRRVGWLGFAPFGVYVLLFLAVPGLVAIASGFFDADGRFTFANFATLADPTILSNFAGSIWLSAVSALISAVLGVLVCWALTAARPDGLVRAIVDSASSVFAQFGGVMLAFAWIATLGQNALVPVILKAVTGVDINANGPILYSVTGLLFPYVYFGLPLFVLSFMPAMDGLRPQWGEAVATLGGTRLHYWLRVGLPVLAPAFFGSLILLFANAFSSYATAAALISQGGIIPLAIKQQLTSETIVGVANTAGVLALGMVVIMAVLMSLYSALDRRTRRWQR
ncbi:ABC transporter permease [Amnibacterium kyonggiense]|uniref:Putative spermidine/putrescine transport system permease protein n=1 Tax=Amnibacterium kyonggiense TaxID=595671 RepID=A0A4R7FM48_9MICO|nr:ABC transporter permease subunit [Amnibacterium kyonggiense]TDS77459.1 putative spermidine/putrescine transport system permease protein [Amnibacterium kyonggiense]